MDIVNVMDCVEEILHLSDKLHTPRGSFAVVRVATHHKTKVKYAVKEVYTGDLSSQQLDDLDKEMCILSQLRHNNICGLHEIYKAPNHVYMVSVFFVLK